MVKKWLLLIGCLAASVALQAAPTPANRYTLGAGDVIKIAVYDHPDLQFEAEITDDGTLNVPLIKQVKLAGLTFTQAENEIAKRLEQGGFVQDAHVNILISGYRSQLVSVIGEVNRPGRYRLEGETTLVTMLANAGGVAAAGGDIVYLLRDGKQQQLYLPSLTQEGNPVVSMMLKTGDQLYVPRFKQVFVYGEVNRPGSYRLEPGMTVMQALAQAGGFSPKADKSDIELQRKAKNGELEKQEVKLTHALQAEDVIFVTESLF